MVFSHTAVPVPMDHLISCAIAPAGNPGKGAKSWPASNVAVHLALGACPRTCPRSRAPLAAYLGGARAAKARAPSGHDRGGGSAPRAATSSTSAPPHRYPLPAGCERAPSRAAARPPSPPAAAAGGGTRPRLGRGVKCRGDAERLMSLRAKERNPCTLEQLTRTLPDRSPRSPRRCCTPARAVHARCRRHASSPPPSEPR